MYIPDSGYFLEHSRSLQFTNTRWEATHRLPGIPNKFLFWTYPSFVHRLDACSLQLMHSVLFAIPCSRHVYDGMLAVFIGA